MPNCYQHQAIAELLDVQRPCQRLYPWPLTFFPPLGDRLKDPRSGIYNLRLITITELLVPLWGTDGLPMPMPIYLGL